MSDMDEGFEAPDVSGREMETLAQTFGESAFNPEGGINLNVVDLETFDPYSTEEGEHRKATEGLFSVTKDLLAGEFTSAPSITNFLNKFTEAAEAAAIQIKNIAVEISKTRYNRPSTGKGFTDRSGDLRENIQGEVIMQPDKITIRLSDPMEYAEYVETVSAGTFAYLAPALEEALPYARQVMIKSLSAAVLVSRARKAAKLAGGK